MSTRVFMLILMLGGFTVALVTDRRQVPTLRRPYSQVHANPAVPPEATVYRPYGSQPSGGSETVVVTYFAPCGESNAASLQIAINAAVNTGIWSRSLPAICIDADCQNMQRLPPGFNLDHPHSQERDALKNGFIGVRIVRRFSHGFETKADDQGVIANLLKSHYEEQTPLILLSSAREAESWFQDHDSTFSPIAAEPEPNFAECVQPLAFLVAMLSAMTLAFEWLTSLRPGRRYKDLQH